MSMIDFPWECTLSNDTLSALHTRQALVHGVSYPNEGQPVTQLPPALQN